ncbi:hypothetical protein [Crateriforma spongiae]|uniref:hypothetical protein n=1 Tax=Crateriforma spongiae TaxID=2724528 RepID=UPI001F38B591|nr:hypothetical protein [Crateriforma spongiae]
MKTPSFLTITAPIRKTAAVFFACLFSLITGCSFEPELYPVTGKVTLDGKAYNRLLVYMRPMDETPDKYSLGVGETDVSGKLSLRSTAGNGLKAGTYRVSFSCMVAKGGEVLDGNEKHDDDRTLVTEDIVPEPFCSDTDSTATFEVKPVSTNEFIFDIPGK